MPTGVERGKTRGDEGGGRIEKVTIKILKCFKLVVPEKPGFTHHIPSFGGSYKNKSDNNSTTELNGVHT